jgi:competence protein ComEC
VKQVVFVGLIGLCFGIICAEWQSLSTVFLCICLVIFCSLAAVYLFDQTVRTSSFYVILIFLCVTSVGLLRGQYAYETMPHPLSDERIQGTQTLTVKIVSALDVRESSLRFIAEPVLQDNSEYDRKHIPNIRITTDRFSDVSYGDVITVEGKISSIVSNNETYARAGEALVRKGVLYEMKSPRITAVSHAGGNIFKRYSIVIHDWVQQTIARYIGEPSAGFINGILIGEKHGLSKEWYEAFTAIGLTHVIVLSGYNLAVLFAWTRGLLRRTSFVIQNTFGALSVITLVLVSGAEAPAVRAGILVLIIALCSVFLRQKDTAYFLSATVLLMLMWNPFYLLYDVSFQLSVAATYGLVYIAPIVETYLTRFPKILSELVRDTSSAQLAVLPLQLFYFGSVSSISLFANVVVLPFIPLLMLLGTVVLVTSFIPSVAIIIGTGTGIISDFVLLLVKKMSTIASPISFSIGIVGLSVAYIFLIIWIQKYKKV